MADSVKKEGSMAPEKSEMLRKAATANDRNLFCQVFNMPPYRLQVSQRYQPVLHYIASRALGDWTDEQSLNALALAIKKFGYEIDGENCDGETPLIIAACMNNVQVAAYLLQLGANAFHADKNGHTAIIAAAFNHNIDMVHLLCDWAESSNRVRDLFTTPTGEYNNVVEWALANPDYNPSTVSTELVKELVEHAPTKSFQLKMLTDIYEAGYHLANVIAAPSSPMSEEAVGHQELLQLLSATPGDNPAASILKQSTVIAFGRR